MKALISSLVAVSVLTGCALGSSIRERLTGKQFDEPVIEQSTIIQKPKNQLPPPAGGPIAVAVYGFQDKTGQRKSQFMDPKANC